MRRNRLQTLFDGDVIKVQRFHCAGAACKAHHEEIAFAHEIVIPTEGVFLRRNRCGEVFGDVTQAVFFSRGEPYEIDHPSDQPDGCFIFSLAEPFLDAARASHPGLADDSDDFRFRHAGLPLLHGDWLRIAQLLADLTRFAADEPLGVEEAVVALLSWMGMKSDEMSEKSSACSNARAGSRRTKLARDVRVYLNDNFRETLHLDEIGAALDASTFHMCRSFREGTGRTINQYLTGLRLRKALDLLADPALTVTGIAYDLGFSSHSHFTSRFHEHFGATPSAVRRQLYS